MPCKENYPAFLAIDKCAIAFKNADWVTFGDVPKFLSKLIYHFLLRKGGLATIVNVHGEYSKDPGQDRFQLNLVVGIKKIYEKMKTSAHNLIQEYCKCSIKHPSPFILILFISVPRVVIWA